VDEATIQLRWVPTTVIQQKKMFSNEVIHDEAMGVEF
jgi:hypothetical protein